MSGVKGVANRNAKTSGKNTNANTSTPIADTKEAVTNKTHEKEKLQVNIFICLFSTYHFLYLRYDILQISV